MSIGSLRRAGLALVLAACLWPRPGGADPVVGEWSDVFEWPITAIHMSLLHTGHILVWTDKGQGEPHLLDPTNDCFDVANGCFSPKPNPINMFCGGQTHLDDGSVIVNGGHIENHIGEPNTFLFRYDKEAQDWNWTEVGELPDTSFARWYPTLTTLPDGRVLNVSGSEKRCSSGPNIDNLCVKHTDCEPEAENNCVARTISAAEFFDPATRKWERHDTIDLSVQFYPFNFVDPDGNVFFAGADWGSAEHDISAKSGHTFTVITPGITSAGVMSQSDGGSAVMYEPGRILKCGGSIIENDDFVAINNSEIIDLTINGQWQATGSMKIQRRRHNLTMLPDGTVLATGGTKLNNQEFKIERTCGGTDDGAECSEDEDCPANLMCLKHPMGEQLWVAEAEIWDPQTGAWTLMAGNQRPRMYHSTALLLPDGRVISAGGGRGGGAVNTYTDAEIFSPPYLFTGTPMPVIEEAPELIFYSQSFPVRSPQAADVGKVSLVRLGAVTHSFDQDTRFVPLSFNQSGDGMLQIAAPDSPNIAPPGYYMLFLVSSAGVPSVARFVRILPADPGRNALYEYSAKIVCGVQSADEELRLAPGSYATSINIHNPGPRPVRFFKKLALTFPPGNQRAGQVLPLGEDVLEYDEALQTDCRELRQRLVPTHVAPVIEGFLIVQSPSSLDVTGVYTTAALDRSGAPSAHSSIDVEQIGERRRRASNLRITKEYHDCERMFDSTIAGSGLGWCDFRWTQGYHSHVRLYTITVTNSGPDTATDIVLDDELVLDLEGSAQGFALIWPFEPITLPNGAEMLEANWIDLQTSRIKVALPDLSPGDSHEIAFWVYAETIVLPSVDGAAILKDTADVHAETIDAAPGDNTATVASQLAP